MRFFRGNGYKAGYDGSQRRWASTQSEYQRALSKRGPNPKLFLVAGFLIGGKLIYDGTNMYDVYQSTSTHSQRVTANWDFFMKDIMKAVQGDQMKAILDQPTISSKRNLDTEVHYSVVPSLEQYSLLLNADVKMTAHVVGKEHGEAQVHAKSHYINGQWTRDSLTVEHKGKVLSRKEYTSNV
ncbi:hypothetical protein PROFUN_04294 [Planoprotostelium fungivorum]|uniref:Uncharacterized protein n=1 Tax=Planoprotostelium fungivorum TaxID=1890364 RepID=A0A2P6NV63_9EUKA|nr:hypothetical protein PROFUN_04294 [Planoprotostelium fungivorum]